MGFDNNGSCADCTGIISQFIVIELSLPIRFRTRMDMSIHHILQCTFIQNSFSFLRTATTMAAKP